MVQKSGFFSVVDELVIRRASRGDVDAFESIYKAFADAVFTLARRLCSSCDEAEDVLQETFLEVSRSIGRFRGKGAFGSWIRRITVSKAIDAQRRMQRKRRWFAGSADSAPGVAERVRSNESPAQWQRLDLERALEKLPPDTRAVVWLHDVEGFTHIEIAAFFGRTVSFSKSQLSRAHARLREVLQSHGGVGHGSEERGKVEVGGS